MSEPTTNFEQVPVQLAEAIAKEEHRLRDPNENWMRLCERASTEQDSEKLSELIREINRQLSERHGNK